MNSGTDRYATAQVLAKEIGNYLVRVDAWLFEQSYALSDLHLTAQAGLDVVTPFAYPRMQEFQDRRSAIRAALHNFAGDASLPYPPKHSFILSLPNLFKWQRRGIRHLRFYQSVLGPVYYHTLMHELCCLQRLTIEVYDVALYRRNLERCGRRQWPNPEENHGVPTA